MKPQRWEQLDKLYHLALQRKPEERAMLLDEVCAGDESLHGEVDALLAANKEAGTFIERPAIEIEARSLANDQIELVAGQTIGHYQIISQLGAGGMAEVYLAEDATLGRKVALKLLPADFTLDVDRVRRFQQEAHAASALNHPNIVTVYEIGQVDDRHFIATEFIDGETLRQLIARVDPHKHTDHSAKSRALLPLREVLNISIQIAEALAVAHETGVVHRDIKPENIMVRRRDGYIKVLDFGLAKLSEGPPLKVDTEGQTESQVKTRAGMVMGTVRYMSPEQTRGEKVDERTDIWSLGAVLYELVTGCAPFERPTTNEVIASILEREPTPLAQLSSGAPAELERIISKALRKDKEERYQAIKDMLVDLKSLKHDIEVTPAKDLRPWWRAHRLVVLVAGAALVISALAWFYFPRPGTNPTMPIVPQMKITPFTSFPGREEWPAFSPDGKQLAFSWNGEKGNNFDIYVKLIDAGAPLRLTTHPGIDSSPTWSPDGLYIAFTRDYKEGSGIYVVPTLGGPERNLLPLSNWNLSYRIVDWSPDGKSLAFTDRSWQQEIPSIFLLSIENREKRKLTSPPAQYFGDWHPAFSPDGQTLAFTRRSSEEVSDIYLVSTQGGEPRRLTFDNMWISDLSWAVDGQSIVFASGRGGNHRLWKVSASGGTPEPLPLGGDNPLPIGMQFSISRQGYRLACSIRWDNSEISRIEVPSSKGQRTSSIPLISSSQLDYGPQFSPDGKRIVFQSERSGSVQIWLCEADGSNPIQLTSMSGPLAGTPRWSPDGRQIAFDARVSNNSDIYVINAEGDSLRPLTTETSNDVAPSWSRDGRWIYFCSNRSGRRQVWKVPAEGGAAVQVTKGGGLAAFESYDGKFIYYSKYDVAGLWKIPVSGGEESLVLDQPREGYWGYWAVVDDGIYFADPETKPRATIKFFNFSSRRVTQIAAIEGEPKPWVPSLAVSPDRRWILYTELGQTGSDIMLVENFR